MPSPTTALALIEGAMRVVGIISSGVGETPTADEASDGLEALNDLLELMSLENLFVWSSAAETFTTVAGQATRTIGPTGQFVTSARPVRISDAYCTVSGVDYPINIIGYDQYAAIPLKTQQQQIIEQLLYINDFPNGLVTLWPTPSAAVPLTLNIDRVMTAIASTATVLSYPPGYLNYMKHALGLMLAPDYGVTPSQIVVDIARTSKASIKRANKQKVIAKFDAMLSDSYPASWQNYP
jgi:hypothetical protein